MPGGTSGLQPAFYLLSRHQCKLRSVHAQELSIKLLEEDPEKNADYLQVGLGALQLDACTQRWVCSYGRETKQA